MINYNPKYVYDQPMFMVTVSVVLIWDNGILVVNESETPENEIQHIRMGLESSLCSCSFPGGPIKAGEETIPSAACRYVKEQLGICIDENSLIPVDFRSDPTSYGEENIVDIGFVSILEKDYSSKVKWLEVDFEKKIVILNDVILLPRKNEILLKRAIDVALMIKEP